jgi:hypothetical protein
MAGEEPQETDQGYGNEPITLEKGEKVQITGVDRAENPSTPVDAQPREWKRRQMIVVSGKPGPSRNSGLLRHALHVGRR